MCKINFYNKEKKPYGKTTDLKASYMDADASNIYGMTIYVEIIKISELQKCVYILQSKASFNQCFYHYFFIQFIYFYSPLLKTRGGLANLCVCAKLTLTAFFCTVTD